MSGWRTKKGMVKLERSSKHELDKAIKDLEKRGYEVVGEPQSSNTLNKNYVTRNSKYRSTKYVGAELFDKWVVMMKKKEEAH